MRGMQKHRSFDRCVAVVLALLMLLVFPIVSFSDVFAGSEQTSEVTQQVATDSTSVGGDAVAGEEELSETADAAEAEPAAEAEAETEAPAAAGSADMKDSADQESDADVPAAAEKKDSAEKSAETAYPRQTFSKEVDGTTVSVVADEGAFPENTTMEVSAVPDSEVKDAVEEAADGDLADMEAIDITFYCGGEKVQPKIPVTVQFSGLDMDGDGIEVYHMNSDNTQASKLSGSESTTAATVEASTFSIYVLGSITKAENGKTSYEMIVGGTTKLIEDNLRSSGSWSTSDSSVVSITAQNTAKGTFPTATVKANSVGLAIITYTKGNSTSSFYITVTGDTVKACYYILLPNNTTPTDGSPQPATNYYPAQGDAYHSLMGSITLAAYHQVKNIAAIYNESGVDSKLYTAPFTTLPAEFVAAYPECSGKTVVWYVIKQEGDSYPHVDGYVKDVDVAVTYHSNYDPDATYKDAAHQVNGASVNYKTGDTYNVSGYGATGLTARTGYSFAGWSTDKSATQAQYSADSTFVLHSSVDLYAVWQKASTIQYTVTKVWNDNNSTADRPDSVTINLLANGKPTGKTAILNDDNNWTYTWTNLEKTDAAGAAVTYSVTEDAVAGYTAVITPYNNAASIVYGNKIENSGGNSVKIGNAADLSDFFVAVKQAQKFSLWTAQQLTAEQQQAIRQTVLANDGNGQDKFDWEFHTFLSDMVNKAFAVFTGGTQQYATTAIISVTDKGDLMINFPDGKWSHLHYGQATAATSGSTVTNKPTGETVEKTVTKTWNDRDNLDKTRPSSISVQLYANDAIYGRPVTVSGTGNTWTYKWTNLPKYSKGSAIVYTVEEVSVPNGYTSAQTTATNGDVTITNSHTPATVSKTVTKEWSDGGNQDGLRTNGVQVQLYNGTTAVGTAVTLNAGNNWTHTWNDLPKSSNGTDIVYSVREVSVPAGYTSAQKIAANGDVTITNSHTPATVSKTVTKAWSDNNDQDGIRPSGVQVQLYNGITAVGEPVTLNTGNSWTYTWSNLPKYNNGQQINYTVREVNVPDGYTSAQTTAANGAVTITNSHTPATVSKTVTKAWSDNNDQDEIRPSGVQVQLYNGITAVGEPVTLNTGNSWTYTWSNLPKYNNGQQINYTVREVNVPDGYTSAQTTAANGAVTITNSHTPATVERTVTKVWNDNNNAYEARTRSVQVQLYADNEAYGEPVTLSGGTDNANSGWTYTWTNLPQKKAGKDITYTVKEVSVPTGYTAAYTEEGTTFTITNTFATVNIGAMKVWNDSGYENIRPVKVSVQLYANGTSRGDVVDLSADNQWMKIWNDLPKYDAGGNEITYSVAEVNVPSGYTASVEKNRDNIFVITNTYTPIITPPVEPPEKPIEPPVITPDNPTPETPAVTPAASKPAVDKSAETGDAFPYAWWMLLAAIGAAGALVIGIISRRREDDK